MNTLPAEAIVLPLKTPERQLPLHQLAEAGELPAGPRPHVFDTAGTEERRHAQRVSYDLPHDSGGHRRRRC